MARAGREAWAYPKWDGCCCWLSTGRSRGGLISRALHQCQSEQGRWWQHLLLSKEVRSQRKAASVSCRAWQPGACGQLCPAEIWVFSWESTHWLWEENIACLCCMTSWMRRMFSCSSGWAALLPAVVGQHCRTLGQHQDRCLRCKWELQDGCATH